MKGIDIHSDSIISTGRHTYKITDEYRHQVELMRNEIDLKYAGLMRNEKNAFKKLIVLLNKSFEMRRTINRLTSLDKMYIR
jgi:hypothetical protein